MNWRSIGIVYRKELVDSLRDRRTIISMILVPVILMPLLCIGVGGAALKIVTKAVLDVPKVMVIGGDDSPGVMKELKNLGMVRIVPPAADFKSQISEKLVRAAVEIPAGFERTLEEGKSAEVPIYFYEGEMKSKLAAERMEQFFQSYRERIVRERLRARGFAEKLIKPFDVSRKNVAPAQKVSGNLIGRFVPYFVVLLCMVGAMYPAMDLAAGEKERGTMETLLCSPVGRAELVLGKFLVVFTASVATVVFSLCSMTASFSVAKAFLLPELLRQSNVLSLNIDAKSLLAFFVMVLPLAAFFSAALFTVSLFAKSFREAQSYLAPLMIAIVLPSVGGMLPGVELSNGLAFVPILSMSLVANEILTGTFHWHYIALIFLSSCLYAALALWAAVVMFKREGVLFRA